MTPNRRPHPRTQLGRQMLFHPAQVCSGAVEELNGLEEVSASFQDTGFQDTEQVQSLLVARDSETQVSR